MNLTIYQYHPSPEELAEAEIGFVLDRQNDDEVRASIPLAFLLGVALDKLTKSMETLRHLHAGS